jgi:hypothetical protein
VGTENSNSAVPGSGPMSSTDKMVVGAKVAMYSS